MIDATVAKFVCVSVEDFAPTQKTVLTAVYSPVDGDAENRRFYEASPYGKIELGVDNKGVHGFFVKDACYRVTIERWDPTA